MSAHKGGYTPTRQNRPRLIWQIMTIAIFRLVLKNCPSFYLSVRSCRSLLPWAANCTYR